MDKVLLRSRFAEFAGEIRYRKFIAQIVGFARLHGRLRYWQQDLWDAFVARFPEHALEHQTICECFELCYLHLCEFGQRNVPVVQGCVDFSREFERDVTQYFPYYARDFVSTEGQPTTVTRVTIHFCEECEAAKQQSRWM